MKKSEMDRVKAGVAECRLCGGKLAAGMEELSDGRIIEHVEPCKNCNKEGKQ